jgi:hypothetical protein
MLRTLPAVLLMALLVAGCAQPAATSSISADAARAAALKEAGSTTPASVVSVERSTYGAKDLGGSMVDPSTQVWAVLLSGTFPSASCGGYTATPHPCPSPATSELILIDAHSGAFIQGMTPAPS